ncbi:MAG: nuclear transport factor 2 family protein [Pseudoxanthomonas mexicana]|nr:nuclear transport factor 2 family protein [Pseudoxanthomonas mexicana]
MPDSNKATLEQANAAVVIGDNEGFLTHCDDDIVWTTVGEGSLVGKAAVRAWMRTNYAEPPTFTVERMVADGDMVVALGTLDVMVDGVATPHAYSDVWRFKDGRMVELRAFVVSQTVDN